MKILQLRLNDIIFAVTQFFYLTIFDVIGTITYDNEILTAAYN